MIATPLVKVTATDTVVCSVVNAGRKPARVSIQLISSLAEQISATLQPDEIVANGNGSLQASGLNDHVFCRFSGSFSKKTVRGAVLIINGASETVVPGS